MIRPLWVTGLDLSTAASGIASTHTSAGDLQLWARALDTAKRPLRVQTDAIDIAVRQACGYGSGNRLVGARRADLVVLEGTFSRGSGSDYPLHHVRANVLQWLWRMGIPVVDVSPATVKVWATGSGATRGVNKVTKLKVIESIIATYGHLLAIPRDDNACDAVALMSLGRAAYGQALAPVQHGRAAEVIDGISWPTIDASTAVLS
jgi:crossover junction endodeoxyribonuclease RuvC